MAAALVASFNGLAGIIGFPIGGRISDKVADKPNGRRNVLAFLTALLTVSIFIFAAYVMTGNHNPVIMSIILFISGLFFFALQPVSHALNAELAPEKHRAAAFGMCNFISEIGSKGRRFILWETVIRTKFHWKKIGSPYELLTSPEHKEKALVMVKKR